MSADSSATTGRRPVCIVTGATGLTGQHVLSRLSRTHDVIAVARVPGAAHPGITWVQADLADPDVAARLPRHADAIVHLAQSRRFREFPEGARDVLAINVQSTEALVSHACAAGVRHFVLASTGSVYAPSPELLAEAGPLASPERIGWYAASKLAAEGLVMAARTRLVPVVLRPFFVYGAGQEGGMLMPRLARTIREGGTITLAGPDGMRLTPTHADDFAEAIVQSLALEDAATINIAGPEILTLRQVAETIGAQVGVAPRFDVQPAVGSGLVPDTARMRALLGPARVRFVDACHTIPRS